MNIEIKQEGNGNISYSLRRIIQLTREWIKNPFKLGPVPQTVIFQASKHLLKGKGAIVRVPTSPVQFPVRPKMVHQHNKEVGYFRVEKGKNKRKRDSATQVEPEFEEIQAQKAAQAPENQEPQNEEATQAQDTPQVPLSKQE